MRRRINRLVAIVELFDLEAAATHTQITTLPDYAVHKLAFELERLHSRALGDLLPSLYQCDSDLVSFLAPLFSEPQQAGARLQSFTDANLAKLRSIVASPESLISPLARQPEALVIWDRLDWDPVALVRHWTEGGYPLGFLEDLATIWGIELPQDWT